MTQPLIERRAEIMRRANEALKADSPGRKSADFVRITQEAVADLTSVAAKMQTLGLDPVEQGRTFRYLGDLYSDLSPALGKAMLAKATEAYRTAESLLEGHTDLLELAKLNFNFAETLRHIDPNDLERLQEARRRALTARAYFDTGKREYIGQADELLRSIDTLIALAPMAVKAKRESAELEALSKQLAAGGDVNQIAKQFEELRQRDGGIPGQLSRLQALLGTIPAAQKQDPRYAAIQQQMQNISAKMSAGRSLPPKVEHIFTQLTKEFESDVANGLVPEGRSNTVRDALQEISRIIEHPDDSVADLIAKGQIIQEFVGRWLENSHYPSLGIERPPAGSRAAVLVELNWQLRRHVMEQGMRRAKGEEESKEVLELLQRAAQLDRRIYEAGRDDAKAATVEKEELRPLAVAVRYFSASRHTMPAQPIWGCGKIQVDTNAVFLSGTAGHSGEVATACRRSGLIPIPPPVGEGYASARWRQLQMAVAAVFDLRVDGTVERAAACYELGIALTLGKPLVVLAAGNAPMPFDIDIDPVVLGGGSESETALQQALDESVVWVYPDEGGSSWPQTIEHVVSSLAGATSNNYVEQTLQQLSAQSKQPDPVASRRILNTLYDFLQDGRTLLIHPRWRPAYPVASRARLFHVMPFGPGWAKDVTSVARAVCEKSDVDYVRGDEVENPDVIGSIWEEIARATHVLVDLTEFNANVCLELGIAHTLGKDVLTVGQGTTLDQIFPSIAKFRFTSYQTGQLDQSLGSAIANFVKPGHK